MTVDDLTFPGVWGGVGWWVVGQFGIKANIKFFGLGI